MRSGPGTGAALWEAHFLRGLGVVLVRLQSQGASHAGTGWCLHPEAGGRNRLVMPPQPPKPILPERGRLWGVQLTGTRRINLSQRRNVTASLPPTSNVKNVKNGRVLIQYLNTVYRLNKDKSITVAED